MLGRRNRGKNRFSSSQSLPPDVKEPLEQLQRDVPGIPMNMNKMTMMEKLAFRKMAKQMEKYKNENTSVMTMNGTALPNNMVGQEGKEYQRFQKQFSSLGDDGETGEVASAAMEMRNEMQQLQSENEALFSKCRKLESQNIIASAQMVDFYAISLGISVTVIAYGIYIRFINYMFKNYCYDYFRESGGSNDTVFDVRSMVVLVWQLIAITLPYVYNRLNYGITYRRFQVFAVAFILIFRIKMTRWRVNKYISKKKESDENDDDDSRPSTIPSEKISQFGEDISEDDIWEGVYEINARFLYSSILRLRGLWTKTAQYLSSRADFVPTAYVRELSKLMDEAPSTDWMDVKKMLQKAKVRAGSTRERRAFIDHFDFIEQEPIASASIGQVHVAKLKKEYFDHSDLYCDGNNEESKGRVVIKVQHPHAQTLLTDDFLSLRIIARIVSILEPEYKFFEILMNEWATEARKELDFRTEVENLQIANESVMNMEKSCSMMTDAVVSSTESDGAADSAPEQFQLRIPFSVEIPRPFPKLSSSCVMVMSFCEGKRIDNLEQIRRCNVPPEAIMNAVSQVFAHQMYVSDIFNGDPHPGNIFIRPGMKTMTGANENFVSKNSVREGFTIVVLDWGLAKRLPDSKRIGFCQMVFAAATLDFGLMMDGFRTLGLKLKRENVAEDMEGIRFLLRDMAPREKARKRVKAKMKTDRRRFQSKKKGERVPMESKAYPGEFFFFVRTNELLHGLGSRLGVDMKYLDVLRSFAEMGIKNSKLYMLNSNHPDPLLTETVADQKLQIKIDDALHSLELSKNIAGAQVCVIDKDGTTLAHCVRGNMGSLKKHLPLRSDSLILGFSVTKATAATLVHRMVQEGYMDYDEPICERIWPKFCPLLDAPDEFVRAVKDIDGFDNALQRWKWKRSITLRHILTHTAGLFSAMPAKLSIKNLASCEICVEAFEYNRDRPDETILPSSVPGTECIYHYLSFGWLVAGCCTGAYFLRHGKRANYEEIYNDICAPLHSKSLKKAGFRPCGGGGGSHDMAYTDADVDISRMVQMRREAEAMGERLETMVSSSNQDDPVSQRRRDLFKDMKGREFMLDPRIWNSVDAINANVPAAGGRFSAKGIAIFYHELSRGNIISSDVLSNATRVATEVDNSQLLQGRTNMVSDNANGEQRSKFGLGYQIIQLPGKMDGSSFGHAGVGGSIGLHHTRSNISLGIMLNKADGGSDIAKNIIETISNHLEW